MDFNNALQSLLVIALPVLLAITACEAFTGWVAHRLGDNTALMMGRVTLNPAKHIDPLGTLILPPVLYLLSQGTFLVAYGKPAPVDFRNFRRPRRDILLVSLASPACNLIMATGWAVVMVVLATVGVQERFFMEMGRAGMIVNLSMWAISLIPVPPFAGGRILLMLLPPKQAQWLARIEPYGFYVVLALLVTGVATSFWLRPLVSGAVQVILALVSPLYSILN